MVGVGEPVHPTANLTADETEKHKHFDHEIRDMIAALTKRLTELHQIHKSTSSVSSQGHGDTESSHHQHHLGHHVDENQNGLQVITLAGSNQGAIMHGDLMDEKLAVADDEDADTYEEALGTYVNSNFQAINNSIMMGGSYTTNDPGVHMEISDFIDHQDQHEHGHHELQPGQKHNAGEKRGKKKKDKEHGKSKLHDSDKSD